MDIGNLGGRNIYSKRHNYYITILGLYNYIIYMYAQAHPHSTSTHTHTHPFVSVASYKHLPEVAACRPKTSSGVIGSFFTIRSASFTTRPVVCLALKILLDLDEGVLYFISPLLSLWDESVALLIFLLFEYKRPSSDENRDCLEVKSPHSFCSWTTQKFFEEGQPITSRVTSCIILSKMATEMAFKCLHSKLAYTR